MSRTKMKNMKSIFTRLPIPLVEQLEEIAGKEYWTMTEVVREAIKYYLKHRNDPKGKPEEQ